MRRINCILPIKISVRGTPQPAHIEALGAALVRAIESQLAVAASRIGAPSAIRAGLAEVVRSPWDATRSDVAGAGYSIPSYDDAGRARTIPVHTGGDARVTRVEIYLAERLIVAFRDSGRPPLVFLLLTTELTAGRDYEWSYDGATHRLSAPGQGWVITFRGYAEELRAFAEGLSGGIHVPARALDSAGASGAEGGDAEKGEQSEPIHGDLSVLDGNRGLAELYLEFLLRYAGLAVPRARAAKGLTSEQVEAIVGRNAQARAVTRYFTQGWVELKEAGSSDIDLFSVLEETILTQWSRGNYNVLRNRLQIGHDTEGFGIFRRGTPIRLYDESGMPIPGLGGGYRDDGFRAAAPPSFAIQLQLPPGLLQVFRAPQQTVVDDPVLVYKAAQAYVDNGDLLWPAVRNGWAAWEEIDAELRRQMPMLVGFLAGHLVAMALQRSGTPWAVAVGAAIEAILWAVGKVFQIVFIGELLVIAYRTGQELSLVRRGLDGRVDPLSQRHLENAARMMRQLLVAAVSVGLTGTLLKAAKETVLLLPPPGGGGGPTPAFARVTGGGRVRSATAPAGAAAGPPTELPVRIVPAPLQMSRAGEPSSSQAPKAETPAQLERRLLKEHRAGKPPTSRSYFSAEKTTFGQLVSRLRRFRAQLTKEGQTDPFGAVDEAALDKRLEQSTHTFINERPSLRSVWNQWSEGLARRRLAIGRELSGLAQKDFRRRQLLAEQERIDKDIAELTAFERGKLGDKEPDLVEFFPEDRQVVVTDITQRPFDPVHNFKTRFYVELLKALTGWTEVYGVDFKDVGQQQLIE